MARSPHRKLVIGWDVRGWMSNEQSVAVLAVSDENVEWLGFCERFRFPQSKPFEFSSLLKPIDGSDRWVGEFQDSATVIAIDAPLAFPSDFRALVNDKPKQITPPASELTNTLAYRQCERWIKEQFGKKPLSASFDKLGNNASLAISFSRSLKREGFSLVPQDGSTSTRSIIEVYPGISKTGMRRVHLAIPPLARKIPAQFEPGTDVYDAAICALLGAVYLGWGRRLNIPKLVQPFEGNEKDEGWIFCLPPDYVRSFQVGEKTG